MLSEEKHDEFFFHPFLFKMHKKKKAPKFVLVVLCEHKEIMVKSWTV